MGQASNPPKVRADEALASAHMIRSSARKLNLVAALIRGMSAGRAMTELAFCKRRVAGEVRKVLQAAIANAENNHELDVDRLYVAEATVGRSVVMRRYQARARGRAGRIEKPFSRLRVVVRERTETTSQKDDE